MGIVFGNIKAGTVMFGGKRIGKAVFGGKTVYKKKDDAWHCPNPFWVEAATVTGTPSVTATGVDGLEYSEDGVNWTPTETFFISAGNRIFYRAKSLGRTSSSASILPSTNVTGIRVGGDVRSLIEDYKGELLASAFRRLFYGASKLVDASELVLDGVLKSYCYAHMFYNCTALTKAPELPATALATYCYQYMFYGCTALTKAPELPVATLASYCYSRMFQGCTALTQAPELPVTTLAPSCYEYMFRGCTKITQPPALPATKLATSCYLNMFSNCTALTVVPELPATTLTPSCYAYMFQGCTALTSGGSLPATTLVSSCYYYMFKDCINLLTVKVYATSWDTSYTSNWLSTVNPYGTLLKPTGVTIPTGTSGKPTGWTFSEFDPAA